MSGFTISGPQHVLRRFLAGEHVTGAEMLRDHSLWEVWPDVTREQFDRWGQLIQSMGSCG